MSQRKNDLLSMVAATNTPGPTAQLAIRRPAVPVIGVLSIALTGARHAVAYSTMIDCIPTAA